MRLHTNGGSVIPATGNPSYNETSFEVRSRSVRGPFRIRSGSVRDPFGPISGQNFWSQNLKVSKKKKLCGRRRRGGGPLAVVPSPAARRAPAAAATAAQFENFCEKFFKKFRTLIEMYYISPLPVSLYGSVFVLKYDKGF